MDTIVKPKTVRLSLSDGQFLDVKRRLNAGEQQDLFAAMAPYLTAGEKPQLKSQSVMTAKILAYLLGWSLMDEGVPIPMSPDMPEGARLATLRSLDPDVFREVREAIDSHETAVDLELEEAKKMRGNSRTSSNSSPLPSDVTGPTTTSVN